MKIKTSLIIIFTFVTAINAIVFRLDEKTKSRCFIIRSEYAKDTVSFSYVVYSDSVRGNRIAFELKDSLTDEVINTVKPDEQSYQKIFKFDSDGSTVYRGCFYNPDDKTKSVKFFIEHKDKETYVEKNKLKASKKMLGKLKEEAVKIEEQMFILYMTMKNNQETFTKSQKFLKFIIFFKFAVLIVVACLQAVGIIKLFEKTNMKLGDLI